MPNIPLSNGFYVDESKNLSNQECVNLYPVIVETEGAFNASALRSPAGLVEFSPDNGEGPCRGAIRFDNKLYTVNGDRFYYVDSSGVKTAIGDTVPGDNRVVMAENGVTITVIIPGTPTGFFYDSTLDTFVEITDPVFLDYGDKIDVTYKDGYFVYLTAKEFFLSSLVITNNGKDFDGLDFSTAEASTDDNLACDTIKNELYIFGQNSVEVFQNTGSVFPFQRIPGAGIDRGIVSPFSTIPFQNNYLFIGAGPNEGVSIWSGLPGQSARISTPAIDNLLQALPRADLADAFTYKYSESGNFFCCFTIPNQITLVFDATTTRAVGRPIWHRRCSDVTTNCPWRVSHIVQVYSEILCTDSIDGRIGRIDLNTFTEYGETTLRRFNTIYFQRDGGRFRVPVLELQTQIGTTQPTIAAVIDDNPQVTLRTSIDGGINFEVPLARDLPVDPSSFVRSVWFQLGQYENSMAMQFDFETPLKVAITKLFAGVN